MSYANDLSAVAAWTQINKEMQDICNRQKETVDSLLQSTERVLDTNSMVRRRLDLLYDRMDRQDRNLRVLALLWITTAVCCVGALFL